MCQATAVHIREESKRGFRSFFSVVGYYYLIYKSGDHVGAFEKVKEFEQLTESFGDNKKMAQLHAVMKAREAKTYPTDAMCSEQ